MSSVTSEEVTLVFDKQNTTRAAANATNQTQTVQKVLQHTCAEYDIIYKNFLREPSHSFVGYWRWLCRERRAKPMATRRSWQRHRSWQREKAGNEKNPRQHRHATNQTQTGKKYQHTISRRTDQTQSVKKGQSNADSQEGPSMRKQRKHLERQQERHREQRALQEQSNEAKQSKAARQQGTAASSKNGKQSLHWHTSI